MGATRPQTPAAGLTFDAGALIAIDRGDGRMIAVLRDAVRKGLRLRVPAGVIGQAWRDGRRQATLARFLRRETWRYTDSMSTRRVRRANCAAPPGRTT